MNYCILNNDNVIENIIVCESDEIAAEFSAVPSYDGARIGEAYSPPPPPPTTEERMAALEAASDRLDAQATYTAMMTDTLMEG